jgi:outer membrane biosynthesis protein TonB
MTRQRLLQQRRRSTASALALALLLAGLALPASAQAENLPEASPTSSEPAPVNPEEETPPVETPPGENPPVETPPGENPPVETPPGENPPVETPPGENPPVETPPGENPPVETPPGENPPAETPPSQPQPTEGQGGSTTGPVPQPTVGGGSPATSAPAPSAGGGAPASGGGGGPSTGTGSGSGSTGGGGNSRGTATTEAGTTAPRASAPGRTLLSTSAADPAAAPVPGTETVGSPPAVSVFLTRDAGVDPGSLTVDLARFYGVGVAYAGFQREENATATLRAPAGTETLLTVENRQDGESTSTGSATVPTAALLSIGTYTVTISGDRGSSATSTFGLTASSAPGILVEPRESSSAEAAMPRGAVWGFGPVESVTVGAYTTAGVQADLAAGDLAVRVDALGWSDLDLGEAVVAEPTAEVYCIVAVGSISKRTAAVTVAYPAEGSTATAPDAAQVCGIAITSAKAGTVPPAASSTGGLSAGVGLTIGAGVLVALLIAGLVTTVVLRRRRENDDLLIGGPLPHPTEQ